MKALLGVLLCYVFTMTQSFAVSGGPWGRNSVTVTGTYAGVFLPVSHSPACVNPITGEPVFCLGQPTGLNSIGLFSLQVSTTGIGTGPVVIFTFGQTYTGTFQGVADPDSSALRGLINATFPYVHTVQTSTDSNGNPVFTTETVLAVASGQVKGKVNSNTNTQSTAGARLRGQADVSFSLTVNNPFDDIIYKMSGFKQASL